MIRFLTMTLARVHKFTSSSIIRVIVISCNRHPVPRIRGFPRQLTYSNSGRLKARHTHSQRYRSCDLIERGGGSSLPPTRLNPNGFWGAT